MEQRMNIRVPTNLPATVHYTGSDGRRTMHTVIRDLGFGGAFVEAGQMSALKGSIIRVGLGESEQAESINIDALVLRSSDDGVGLMFAYLDDDVFDQLASLLEPELDKRFGRSRQRTHN